MKIYKVSHDLKYQQLIPVEESFFRENKFHGDSVAEGWVPPTFYVNDPLFERGDFFNISLSILCFTEKVFHSELGSLLGATGEILEANIEGESESVYILNPLIRYNCLNHSGLEYRDPFTKVFPMITKFSFHSNRIGDSTIFKLPDSPSTPTLCLSSPNYESFHDLYHNNSLTGLKFYEIWSES